MGTQVAAAAAAAATTAATTSTAAGFSFRWVVPAPSQPCFRPSSFTPLCRYITTHHSLKSSTVKTRATLYEENNTNSTTTTTTITTTLIAKEVEESVKVLKEAAKTRKVPEQKILSALSDLAKAKLDPSSFLQTLGGTNSPGRTWMLIFTAEKGLKGGKYFPITAVQRFDAAGKRIENGVYLGPIGQLTFEGRFSWEMRTLAFVFEGIRVKIGPFNPFEINFKGKDDEREPSIKGKDPFFVWFYIDEEIAVARGRSGGTAFWVRCCRVSNK